MRQSYGIVLVVFVLLATAALLLFFFWGNMLGLMVPNAMSVSTTTGGQLTGRAEEAVPTGFIKYQNEHFGFTFFHPPGGLKEHNEGFGAATVVYQDATNSFGFQVFVVPYKNATISEERFAADVPSGVRTNTVSVNIGKGAIQAVSFDSYDQALGDTKEIWFLYNGYLYEVTTLKTAESLLAPILETWQFLK